MSGTYQTKPNMQQPHHHLCASKLLLHPSCNHITLTPHFCPGAKLYTHPQTGSLYLIPHKGWQQRRLPQPEGPELAIVGPTRGWCGNCVRKGRDKGEGILGHEDFTEVAGGEMYEQEVPSEAEGWGLGETEAEEGDGFGELRWSWGEKERKRDRGRELERQREKERDIEMMGGWLGREMQCA